MVVITINKRQEDANKRREGLIKRAMITRSILKTTFPEIEGKRVGVAGTPVVIRPSHSIVDKTEYFVGSTDGKPPVKVPLEGVKSEDIKRGKRPLSLPEIQIILSKNQTGIGSRNCQTGKWCGIVVPNFERWTENGWERVDTRNLTHDSFFEKIRINGYLITCWHCGTKFQTNNAKRKYCSDACARAEETYLRAAKRHMDRIANTGENLGSRKCPICHEVFSPKTIKSPTCGKAKCRTAWSRRLSKS